MSTGVILAAAAARTAAVNSVGIITRLEPEAFLELVARQAAPLVVHAAGGMFTTKYKYLTSYKGLAFVTTSTSELTMPPNTELIIAKTLNAMI